MLRNLDRVRPLLARTGQKLLHTVTKDQLSVALSASKVGRLAARFGDDKDPKQQGFGRFDRKKSPLKPKTESTTTASESKDDLEAQKREIEEKLALKLKEIEEQKKLIDAMNKELNSLEDTVKKTVEDKQKSTDDIEFWKNKKKASDSSKKISLEIKDERTKKPPKPDLGTPSSDKKESQQEQDSKETKQEKEAEPTVRKDWRSGPLGTVALSISQSPYFVHLKRCALGMLLAAGLYVVYQNLKEPDSEIPLITEAEFFQQLLPSGTVDTISKMSKKVDKIYKYYVVVTSKDGSRQKFPISTQSAFGQKLEEYLKQHPEHPVKVTAGSPSADQMNKVTGLISFLGIALTIMVIYFYFISSRSSTTAQGGVGRGMGGMLDSITKNKTKMYSGENIKISFKDVAGHTQAKQELQEFVEFLKNPEKYKKLGARIPRGAIMSGPPGTGKTLMAKAVAGESGVPFFAASGSEFVEIFVGVGAARVRDLFATARSEKKAIIFIDEIDAVGQKRDSRDGGEEREQTLNQLLVEMDGFGSSENIIVFAATNRYDMLDAALVRPGRFDRNVELNLPDLDARRDIYGVHLKKLKINPLIGADEYARRLATLSPGFSGSDIATICNEAAIQAVRNNKDSVDSSHFEEAVERLIGGVRVTKSISPEEERTIAYHEAGHGVVSWFLKGARPLLKMSIIPRSKGALGFAQYLPNEDIPETREDMVDMICSILGGRVSEQVFFGKVTTGAYDDLQKVRKIARAMIMEYGLSERLGLMSYKTTNSYGVHRHSDATAKIIDEETSVIVKQCTERTFEIIQEKKELIEKIAEGLIQKKTLDLKQITSILGPRPFTPSENFREYLEVIDKNERDREILSQTAQTTESPSTPEAVVAPLILPQPPKE